MVFEDKPCKVEGEEEVKISIVGKETVTKKEPEVKFDITQDVLGNINFVVIRTDVSPEKKNIFAVLKNGGLQLMKVDDSIKEAGLPVDSENRLKIVS